MNHRRYSQEQARKNGFYLALAVCLVAVGIAAWSTYDTVHSYLMPLEDARSQPGASSAVSTPAVNEDPEAPRASASPAPTATPKPSSAAPASKSPKPAVTPAPEADPANTEPEETPMVPANAPLYELSSEMIYPVGTDEASKAYSAGAPVYSQTMKDWRIHRGTDLPADSGETVVACANGQVKQTYTDAMLGNVVLIEHGDYEISYCGLGENFQVSPGDIVTIGQPIGTVTAVPSEAADDVHLHLEVRRDGVFLDPQDVLSGHH